MSFKRLAPSAVLAVGVTCLITLGMAAMIKTEFTPQDKTENLVFDINPQVEEPPVITRTERNFEINRVETPPPPPVIDREKAAKPTERIADIKGAIPVFKLPVIDKTAFFVTVSDGDATPTVRIAPIMPPRAEKSGHCKVRFNVSAEGAPYDITATYCTQSLFERATIKSVSKWKFNPKIVNDRAVAMTGVTNKVTYILKDERGNIIPE